MQHDVGERYRKVFKEQTESAKEELSGKLEVADRLTGEKRELATQVQALQVCIGEAEGRIKKGVETVLKEGEVEREEQAACWGEGEAVRREKWLERKTMEIREVTIKGLEPEVARIIEMHKGEVERMEGEFKERKREWLRKHYDTVEENKVQIGEKAMRKYDTIIKVSARKDARKAALCATTPTSAPFPMFTHVCDPQVTREAGNDRLTDVHSSHADNLVRLRLKLQDESDALRRWQQGELKRIAEAHADECASVRVTEGKRLEEVRRRQKEEVEAGERGAQSALEALENDSMSVREVWENKIRNKIVKESLDVLEKEREELKARRDGEIEKAIRKGQMGFADLRSREACNVKELQEAAKAEFDLRIKGIMDKKNRWVEKLAENVDLTRELVDEKGRHGKTLIALEDYMGKLDGDIEDALRGREEHKALLVTEEERVGERKGRDLKVLMMDRVAAEKGVGEVRRELEGRMLRGKDAIRVCKSEHEKDLEALERRVKVEVGDISGQIREVEEVISGQMVRCEHAKKMIESYRGRRKAGAEKDKKLRAF